ncbi:MAG: hypothetical protein WD512_03940, partial [Candidatus Paceibacterota bacterium]
QNYDTPNIPATGWLLKLDTLGEIIWERLVSRYNNQNNSSEYISDLKIDNNGWIYMSGYVIGGAIITNGVFHSNDAWLCKTDSCGFTTGAQPQALLTIDSVVGAQVYLSNLSEEYCIGNLAISVYNSTTGDTTLLDSLHVYAYSQFTNGTNPSRVLHEMLILYNPEYSFENVNEKNKYEENKHFFAEIALIERNAASESRKLTELNVSEKQTLQTIVNANLPISAKAEVLLA